MNIDEFIIYLNNYLGNKFNDIGSAIDMLKVSLFWLIIENAELKKAGMLINELTKEKGKSWNDL